MKQKIVPITLIMVLVLVGIVLGTPTFTSPSDGSNIRGSVLFNVTTTDFAVYSMGNCTISGTSSIAGNSTTTIILYNYSAVTNSSNATYNTALVQDSDDWVFSGYCTNGTANSTITSITVTIDNTIPQAPTLSPSDETAITTPQAYTFTGTVTDVNTTSCSYIIYRGSAIASDPSNYFTGTGSYSGTSCTFTKEFSSGNTGIWTWYLTASDETNTTSATAITFKNNIPTGGSVSLNNGQVITTASESATATPHKSFFQWLLDIIKGIFKIK